MRWYVYNWPNLSAVVLVALSFVMGLWGHDRVDTLTLILIYSFMALLAHQCEEFLVPGGVPAFLNVMYGGKKDYDRYPINAANGALINIAGFVFYLGAIVFPHAIWLGVATMFFGFVEVLVHGVPMNIKSKGWYNPGLATAIFLFLPIGIYYIVYVTQHDLISGGDWLWGALALVVAAALGLGIPLVGLKNRNSKYAFTSEQLNRFHMLDKLKQRGVI